MKKIIFLTIFGILMCRWSQAEVIYLKDGSILKGKVTGKTKYYTTVQTDKYPQKIFNDQIDRIEGDIVEQLDGVSVEAVKAGNVSEEKASLILKLLKLNGTRERVEENVREVISQTPPETQTQMKAIFDADEILAQLIPVYSKYYTEEDLLRLIEFYNSEIGQKVMEISPHITQEVVETTLQYFQKKVNSSF